MASLEAGTYVARTPSGIITIMEGRRLELCVRRVIDLYPNIRQFVLMSRASGSAFLERDAQSVA